MALRRGSNATCTAERLEEVFSNTRTERSLAEARKRSSGVEMPVTTARRPLPFPSPSPRTPFLTQPKNDPFPRFSQTDNEEDELRHYRLPSGGEDVETSVLSFLVVFTSCTWLLFWLISQLMHIVVGAAH